MPADESKGDAFLTELLERLKFEFDERGVPVEIVKAVMVDVQQRPGTVDLSAWKLVCLQDQADDSNSSSCQEDCQWNSRWRMCVPSVGGSKLDTTITTTRPEFPIVDGADWVVGEWGACSALCGAGEQERDVFCAAEGLAGSCSLDIKPFTTQPCESGCELYASLIGGVT